MGSYDFCTRLFAARTAATAATMIAASGAALVGVGNAAQAATITATWAGGSGSWGDASNWQGAGGTVPDNDSGNDTYNVIIDGDGTIDSRVRANSAFAVADVTIASGDSLWVESAPTAQFAFDGGAVDIAAGALLRIGEVNALGAATMRGGTTIDNDGIVELFGTFREATLNIEGTTTIGGSGVMELRGQKNEILGVAGAASILVNEAGHTIRSLLDNNDNGAIGVGNLQLRNAGTVSAEARQPLVLHTGSTGRTSVNTGTLRAAGGGSLRLIGGDGLANTGGTLTTADNGSLDVQTDIAGGAIAVTSGGQLLLDVGTNSGATLTGTAISVAGGATLDSQNGGLSGGSLEVVDGGGNNDGFVNFHGGTITGTAMTIRDGATLRIQRGSGQPKAIDGGSIRIDAGGKLELGTVNQLTDATFRGGTTIDNDGIVELFGTFREVTLNIEGTTTIGGSGVMELRGQKNEILGVAGEASVLVNEAGHTIRSLLDNNDNGAIGVGNLQLRNAGTVSAEARQPLVLHTGSTGRTSVNTGTLRAAGGGSLRLIGGDGLANTGGTLTTADNGSLDVQTDIAGGAIAVTSGGQLLLDVGTNSGATLTGTAISVAGGATLDSQNGGLSGGSLEVVDGGGNNDGFVNFHGGTITGTAMTIRDGATLRIQRGSGQPKAIDGGSIRIDAGGKLELGTVNELTDATFRGGTTIDNDGLFELRSTFQPTTLMIEDTLTLQGDGVLDMRPQKTNIIGVAGANSRLVNEAGHTLSVSRTSSSTRNARIGAGDLTLINRGAMLINDVSLTVDTAGDFRNDGVIQKFGGSRDALFVDPTVINDCIVGIETGGTVVANDYRQDRGLTMIDGTLSVDVANIDAGFVTGGGRLSGDLVNAGGVLSPGREIPGGLVDIFRVSGDYSQGAGATLFTDLAGSAPSEFDRLIVDGAAALGGALAVSVDLAFAQTLTAGDRFRILETDFGITGDFAAINDNIAGLDFSTVIDGNDLYLEVAGRGGTLSLASGAITARAPNFEDLAASKLAADPGGTEVEATGVPAPASLPILLIGILALAARRRHGG